MPRSNLNLIAKAEEGQELLAIFCPKVDMCCIYVDLKSKGLGAARQRRADIGTSLETCTSEVELGFEAVPCTIVGSIPGVRSNLPNLRNACNVMDAANLLIELDGETVNPRDLICEDVEALGDMARGFIFSLESICNSEQDLSFIEANLTENTVVYVVFKGCTEGVDYLLKWQVDNDDIADKGEAFDYFFDRHGQLLEKRPTIDGRTGSVYVEKMDRTVPPFIPLLFADFVKYDMGFFHEYIALVAGESSDNYSEGQGIGAVLMNRLVTPKGLTVKKDKKFLYHLGGIEEYDARKDEDSKGNKTTYYDITHRTIENAINSETFGLRIRGAISALSPQTHSEINPWIKKAYFWEGKKPYLRDEEPDIPGDQPGYYRRNVAAGKFIIVADVGQTFFFTYSPTYDQYLSNRGWP